MARISPEDRARLGSTVSATTCLPTFSAAVLEATGGFVALDPEADPNTIAEMDLAAPGVTVIGVSFAGPRFSGGTLLWVTDNELGCETGLTYSASSMPVGWNDVVSSAVSLGGCGSFSHYEFDAFEEPAVICTCSVMFLLHDRTSSVRWAR